MNNLRNINKSAISLPHLGEVWRGYHPDHLGSSSWITDVNGVAIQHLQYLPFGELRVNQRSTTWNSRYTFSGKEKDTESGYGYFGARYYSSDLSIWISVDPLASKYPSLSPYVYCANNPVILVDPDGEEIELITHYKKDANGNNTKQIERYELKITGKVLNQSGKKVDMEKATNKIISEIENSFQGETKEGIPISTTANLTVANSMNDVSESDHLFSISKMEGAYGAVNKIGGRIAYLNVNNFKGPIDGSFGTFGGRVAAHEMGHLFGLTHRSEGLMRKHKVNDTSISANQLSSIVSKFPFGNGLFINRGTSRSGSGIATPYLK